jgi:ASPIC and UnbV/FG-GAP-like repeat
MIENKSEYFSIRRFIIAFSFIPLFFSCKSKTLFRQINADESGIHFNNIIQDNDTLNILDVENIYNGGGVGVGDFNNDHLQDIYFTGNTVSNKLYLNKGNFRFEDVTDPAGVSGSGRWSRGVSVVDINNDGLQDIYVCATLLPNPRKRENILYINTGIDDKGIPHFKNMAAEYGLADTVHSTMAAFFDYDNDGDLDMYLVVNEIIKGQFPGVFRPILKNREHPNTDKLFRNDWNDSLKHSFFTDISAQAGITIEGFGHGVNITDINMDGWKDIYVTNDFIPDNLLYINNHNGTFTNKAGSYFKHTSESSMGQDIMDINNDGLPDVIEVDMNPEDNYRKKTMMNSIGYQRYQNNDYYGYQYQYVRNVLQLNQGPCVKQNDSIGDPIFSDISFLAGVAETDWSWTPLVQDFDNDGFRDIIVTNGFPRDVTDHDFIAFRRRSSSIATKEYMLGEIPQVKLHNYAFHNSGNLAFDNVTDKWGLTMPSFSNGAVYADIDNDGDLDVIVNNINDNAFVYENTANSKGKTSANYLQIKFNGDRDNLNGLGAIAEIYYNKNQRQVYENSPYRGYLSSIDPRAFFGLGNVTVIDSVIIKWPENKKQVLRDVKANQLLSVDIKNAGIENTWINNSMAKNTFFTEVTNSLGVNYKHEENDFIDFDRERLLPHKLSQYGPGLAAGDIDGNGLDDICIGGPVGLPGKFLLQQTTGKFVIKDMPESKVENMGILFFDADNDGDLDLYCASGSNEFPANSENYQDCFFVNDRKGNFTNDSSVLPINHTSKSCIRASDFDNDGDLDLFIAGRCLPGKYPLPVSSFIYRNDSKNGEIKFADVTAIIATGLQNIGMICDALWTDFDNDGWIDLLVCGEWMPVTFFKNNRGKFENVSSQSEINNQLGWWNSITSGDFDNDGDIDYIAGNLGENSFFRASDQYPVSIYAKDFDKNGSLDAIVTVFLKDKKGVKREYTALNRDDIVSQLPPLKKKFLTYKDFASADIHQMFTADEMKDALILRANNFKSCFIKNNGAGKFGMVPLPAMAQLGPLNGMIADDFNSDGNLDVMITGNDYGNEVTDGRYDAINGLVLLGDGQGNFIPQSILQSGFFVPGDAKALIKLRGNDNNYLVVASQNRGPLKLFNHKNPNQKIIPLQPLDVSALVIYKNGKKQKREVNYGSSFLSQSGRFLNIDNNIVSVEIKDSKGNLRKVSLQ